MPSLESIDLKLQVSNEVEGCLEDFAEIRDALCGIKSDKLQHIGMRVTLWVFDGILPEVCVSPSLL